MATAREYFDKSTLMQFGVTQTLATNIGASFDIRLEVVQDFDGGSKYLKVYVPEADDPDWLLAHVIDNIDELIWKPEGDTHVTAGLAGGTEQVNTPS